MKIYVPSGSTEVSARGMVMKTAADGSVDVSADIVQDLISVGCTLEAPEKPPTAWKTAADDKAKDKVKKAQEGALKARDEARAALFEVEGRGNIKAVTDAQAVLDAAQAAVDAGAKS